MNIVRRMVLNPVAANMLMILILGGGLWASFSIPRELFPEFSLEVITVSVPYPGAMPEDVEKGICKKIEDPLSRLEGIKEISSQSREGMGLVTLELESRADVRKVLDEVKSEVDKIDFPDDAEDPEVRQMTLRRHVIQVAVAGETDERTLKELAEEIRDDLSDLPEISQVSVSGVRNYEITIEVSEQALRQYKLTLARIARAVRENSIDLPAGKVRTSGGELSVRVTGQKETAEQYRGIIVLSKPDGTVVRLSDIATVTEGFEDVDVGGQFNGQPAALVSVYKTPAEDSIKIAKAVRRYVDRKRSTLPAGITLEVWADMSKLIQDRLDMLVRNGLWGLGLVLVILWIFLGLRLSVWVAMGIPISLLGVILVLNLSGMTLNMMSMFALIMSLGLIVDDAIVVGENVYAQTEKGTAPRLAAITGTRSVLMPVTAAVLTTWVAFVPLLHLPGVMGKFIIIMPIVVIVALAFSLLECVLILPSHLAHSLRAKRRRHEHPWAVIRWSDASRARIDRAIRSFIDGPFIRLYRLATGHRYITLALFASMLMVMIGAYMGGHIPVSGFPKIDSDTLVARITLTTGTPFSRTKEVARKITMAALKLNQQVPSEDGQPIVRRVYSLLGQHSGGRGAGSSGGHLCEVIVELKPSEKRGRRATSEKLIEKWRSNTGPIPEALGREFVALRGGPGGKSLEIRLLAPSRKTTDYVKPAAEQLKARLAEFKGVTDISDDALPGSMEMKIRVKPSAEPLGIDNELLGRQLRSAFYGNESMKIQRGRDEIKVMVRYPQAARRSLGDIERMRIRTPRGAEVPFSEAAEVVMGRGYTTLRRAKRRSVITVSADTVEGVANAEQIIGKLRKKGGFFDQLASQYPGLKFDLRGQRQQMTESFGALKVWFPLALLGIFTILAALFRSYVQPIIIMVAIPFGLIGAVIGHLLLGFDVTLLSMFGMVALAGIVVNDSLVLIDRINGEVRSGGKVHEAVELGGRTRFRPIILTTITTVVGIGPLLFERSFQAQFLKPMAVSIAFGLMFATTLTLILVPCLYLIGNDIRRSLRWLRTGNWVEPEAVVRRDEPPPETDDKEQSDGSSV